jgi:1-acyl-sn-glycerol-3-phosphate acyltransferase
VITTAAELRSVHATTRSVLLSEASTALLQYTSGSTGHPKGVVLTHANVLANISALGHALDIRAGDVFVSWLPLYHDMGLIGAWLGTWYLGLPLIVMSPLAFLNRPVRWLEAIHRYHGTLSAAPNFAYELCLKRVGDDEISALDLSTWRIAMNGAEAVMPDTLSRFQERFTRCGFPRTSLTPVYGLAECSVGLTTPPLGRGPRVDAIERDAFVHDGLATPARQDSTNTLRFVSCGRPLAGHQVRIVDDAGHELPERREGRLTFRGPSTTQGYYRNPEQTKHLIRDGWLDSGDRAYATEGEIYVTGRIKDIIIRAGRHIYPDEMEAAVGAVAGVRKGCVAVFGSTDATTGTERVIVLAETRVDDPVKRESLHQAIVGAVVQLMGEPPDEVVLAAPHTVLKTSSGKIRRAASREVYESRSYRDGQGRTAWRQVMRLGVSALRPAFRQFLRTLLKVLYGAYFWMAFGVLGSIALLIALLPLKPQTAWTVMRTAARLFLRLAGIEFAVQGNEPTRSGSGRLIVANHSSYLDGLFLIAALPRSHRFVAKRELASVPIVGMLLRRLGTVFVERFDARAGVEDAHRLAKLADQGESFIFFPEGTFTRAPGLLPFHLGAFAASIEADRPLVPLALRGTRALLRDGQWLPRRVPVIVHIGQPIVATRTSNAFSNVVQLREAARRFILEHCGETDLAGLATNESGSAVRMPVAAARRG